MSEPATTLDVAFAPGERLAALCANLARSLEQLLGMLPSAGESPLRESREFLAAVSADVGPALPIGSGEDAIDRLVDGLGLSPAETDVVLLAGLAEEHEGYAGVLRHLNPRGEPWPTAGLAARLFCATAEERRMLRALLDAGRAVTAGVLVLDPDVPMYERGVRVAEGLWSALAGVDVWPAQADVRPDGPIGVGLDGWLNGPSARCALSALASREACTIAVTADSEEVALHRACALVAAAGQRSAALVVPAARDAQLERLLLAHALVRGVVPVISVPPLPDGDGVRAPAPSLGDWPQPVVLAGRAGMLELRGPRPVLLVPAEPVGAADRRTMWRSILPGLAAHAGDLAAKSAVEPFMAAEVATDLGLRARHVDTVDLADAIDALRTRASVSLTAGVKLTRPRASWDQLVLPADARAQLLEAVDRLRYQPVVLDDWGFLAGRSGARGVRMLLAGPPGTGKTLSAEILAGALESDLLVVELARIVSKWIGETEKNLAHVFDAAERSHAVLLFDEADALFGKRTEVTDAHDRYANLETAYLLMRLEQFEGLAVLSTNLRQNIDPAFTRRLEFVVEFDEPGPAERKLLWRGHLPPGAPLADDVDLGELAAHYPVVGGVIRNAAVAAGFLAASNGNVITRDHLVRSLRREYEKTGRAFPGHTLRPSIT